MLCRRNKKVNYHKQIFSRSQSEESPTRRGENPEGLRCHKLKSDVERQFLMHTSPAFHYPLENLLVNCWMPSDSALHRTMHNNMLIYSIGFLSPEKRHGFKSLTPNSRGLEFSWKNKCSRLGCKFLSVYWPFLEFRFSLSEQEYGNGQFVFIYLFCCFLSAKMQ